MSGPSGLFGYDDMWNRRELRAAELPSSNGIGTARALARLYAALIGEVDGMRLLRPETVAAACAVQSDGDDRVLLPADPLRPRLHAAAGARPGRGPQAFGHPGAGGSLGFADPDARLRFGYVMNQMSLVSAGDPRATALLSAVYECLAA